MTTDQSKCPTCGITTYSKNGNGVRYFVGNSPCSDSWHDTPADSAPVAGSLASKPSQEDVVPAAGGGDTPETDAFPTRKIEREIEFALKPRGMRVGMPHVNLPVELVQYVLARSRNIERQRDAALAALKARSHQLGVACEKHDLIHALECGYCFKEMRERAESSEAKIADLEGENAHLIYAIRSNLEKK